MKQNMYKKMLSVFVAFAMFVSMLPTNNANVYAQNTTNVSPNETQFATVEQLKSFNTDDTDGAKISAKVYFGNNNQQWWIAGSQQANGLTLFATSPIASNQKFNELTGNIPYSEAWGCFYENNPADVVMNHYGASLIRSELAKLSTEYFTNKEQSLMNKTKIYTKDMQNKTKYYTEENLYLAYGDDGDYPRNFITVGSNTPNNQAEDDLNKGLRVDMNYWIDNGFWLRTPYFGNLMIGTIGEKKNLGTGFPIVSTASVHARLDVVPAFELNVSNVAFGSTIAAVSKEGMLTNNDAFTLRYDASKNNQNLGVASVSLDKNAIKLSNVPRGTYLVVQYSTGAKAKLISTETTVNASDMGLPSFENCKVWLETTDATNRMTYATLATQEEAVASVGDKQYTTLQEAFDQADLNDTVVLLKDITIDENVFVKKIINLDLNGKILHGKTLNGIPMGYLVNANSFNIINKNKGDIKCNLENYGTLSVDGSISSSVWNDKDGTIKSGIYLGNSYSTGKINGGIYLGTLELDSEGVVNAGTFKNEIRGHDCAINGGNFYSPVTLDGFYAVVNGGSFAQEPILKNGGKLGEGKVLIKTNHPELPYNVMDETKVAALDITVGANLTHESGELKQVIEKNTDIQSIIINIADKHYLEDTFVNQFQAKGLTVTKEGNKITISGALSDNLTITLNATKKTNGNDVIKEPTNLTTTYTKGLTLKDVTLPEGWIWVKPNTSLPAGTSSYEATFDVTDLEHTHDFTGVVGYDKNTHKVTRNLSVKVNKADSSIELTTSSLDKTYDGTNVNNPEYTKTGSTGQVSFTFEKKVNDTWNIVESASEAGTYRVTAILAEDANYNSATSTPLEFTIVKANPNPLLPTNLTVGKGKALSTVALAKGFAWVDDTLTSNTLGSFKFEAIYTPEDTNNYNSISVMIDVKVVPTLVVMNAVPTIDVKNQTITVGDHFDPFKDVVVMDEEDGMIKVTKEHIIKNTVDTTKVGMYEVTYKVTDRNGASITKTMQVNVVEAIKDKEALEQNIKDQNSNVNQDAYTKESYDAYQEALQQAQTILNNPNASKEEIKKALEALDAAYQALVKKPVSIPSDPTGTGDVTNLGMLISFFVISVLMIVFVVFGKKKLQ